MAIIKQFDKRSGITYVYDSKSYYDKEKKCSRAKRTLIGKLDPETGERGAENVKALRGHWVKVTFQAKLSADAEYVTVAAADNKPVESDKDHTGVDNKASYVVDTDHAVCSSGACTPSEEQPQFRPEAAQLPVSAQPSPLW